MCVPNVPFITVHPRACGEHASFTSPLTSFSGSSPRLRGTQPADDAELSFGRFIPAPAGNTASITWRTRLTAVHPRACGEHAAHGVTRSAHTGSSPRLRGTRTQHEVGNQMNRFIPAPAGNTSRRSRSRSRKPVHPRACGEHQFSQSHEPILYGSSPRLRGTPGTRSTFSGIMTVHPRACGEHPSLPFHSPSQCGSSPRLRGTLFLQPTENFNVLRFGGIYQIISWNTP